MNKYDLIAEGWIAHQKKAFTTLPVQEFSSILTPSAWILDIGCGSGEPNATYLTQQGHHITGIDTSAVLIAHAQSLTLDNSTFLHCDFFDYAPEQLFQGIIAYDSLFHFPLSRQVEIYPRLSSWLDQGGYVLFSHGAIHGELNSDMFGETFYYSSLSLEDLKIHLRKSNLEIVKIWEDYKEQHIEKDLIILARKY